MSLIESTYGPADDIHTFAVVWNDGVANEWVAYVAGPVDETERRLREHADRGRAEGTFVMDFLRVSGCIGSDRLNIEPTYTADEFFALPWDEDEPTKLWKLSYTHEWLVRAPANLDPADVIEHAGPMMLDLDHLDLMNASEADPADNVGYLPDYTIEGPDA